MSIPQNYANTVQDIVRIANDGADFYRDAMEKTDNPNLRSVFSRMLSHKQTLAGSLRSKLKIENVEAPKDGTFAGSLRKTYADLRAKLSSSEDKVYVAQLEETEDRLLKHFEKALDEIQDPSVKSLLQSHAPQVRACHDEMSQLKKSIKH
jgi:uncharacterized protein (TIGR02284 family)